MKTLYQILGVEPSASQDEIRSAYRKKVMEFHPDHYGSDTSPFHKIQEAYSVLIDPEQRRIYDDTLQKNNHLQPQELRHTNQSVFSPYDISGLFVELRHKLHQAFSPGARGYDVEVILNPLEARTGGKINLKIPVQEVCPSCKGYCYKGFSECRNCKGTGIIPGSYPFTLEVPAGIRNRQKMEILIKKYNILLCVLFVVG